MKSWIVWGGTLLCFIAIGAIVGFLLDVLVWHVSYDYVYAPGYFFHSGIKTGFYAGSFVAFLITFIDSNSLTLIQCCVAALLLSCCIVLGSVCLAVGYGLLAKVGLIYSQHKTVIPLTRLYFCDGLIKGAVLGGLVGALVVLRFFTNCSRNARNQSNQQVVS